MLNIISILCIFILDSIPQATSKGYIIMPYFTYLAYRKDKVTAVYYPILAIILALHTSSPVYNFIFAILNFLIYYAYFSYFSYNFLNICILSIIQITMWRFYVNEPFLSLETAYLFVVYLIINYIYMRRATK